MDWVASIHQAIQYIEEHLREELTIREIAQQAALSPFYFQKGFAMLCGITAGDYIRQRRLSAAGLEVLTTDRKIIDIALEFGYDSPDSFTKAFVRFHGLTPAALRKSGGAVRSFAPLRIKLTLEGGQNMDCKIMKKEAFTVLCRAKTFKYEDAAAQVPQFWAEHFGTGGGKVVCGMYGINLDESMGGNEFEYLIADNYDPAKEIPDGFTTRTIPAHTWAVFPCTGRMPQALQGLNQQIFSQWLPTNPDYKIAASMWSCIATPAGLRTAPRTRTTTARSGSRWKRSKAHSSAKLTVLPYCFKQNPPNKLVSYADSVRCMLCVASGGMPKILEENVKKSGEDSFVYR